MSTTSLVRMLAGATILVFLVTGIRWLAQPGEAALLRAARRAFARREFTQAETLALVVARRAGTHPDAWLLAGDAAARNDRWTIARQHYLQITDPAQPPYSLARYNCGECSVKLQEYSSAEQYFNEALQADPQLVIAKRRLADLLIFTGRRYAAVSCIDELLRMTRAESDETFRFDDLFHLGDPDHAVSRREAVWAGVEKSNADPLLILGAAVEKLSQGDAKQARALFERVLQKRPDDPVAFAGWGQSLLLTTPDRIAEWSEKLSGSMTNDPGVWHIEGQIAAQRRDFDLALQRFAKVLLVRPTSRIAWHHFGLALKQAGHAEGAVEALDYARQLDELGVWLNELYGQRTDLRLMRRVALRLSDLDRLREAGAWARHAFAVAPGTPWATHLMAEIEVKSPQWDQRLPASSSLNRLLDDFARSSPGSTAKANPRPMLKSESAELGPIQFEDLADATGLQFTYRSARDSQTPGARLIETTGGGAGVIDYDSDGWPDLYFPQGSQVLPATVDQPDGDCLFRNLGGKAFIDVSVAAGIGDRQYGQGIAVGDVDNDGFADLLVANYGTNRLYRNQGDGTFREVTRPEMQSAPAWTSSCVIADFNHDSLPDLFEVTYCRGMARLDWNRDGRDDAVLVNQDSPVVLLTNQSPNVGHSLILQLRGTRGACDAIGAIVTVQVGAKRLTRQLTAGDGFQASNESQLIIGLGNAGLADDVTVDWLDGSR